MIPVPAAATLRDLRTAEAALNQAACPSCWTDVATGRTLSDDDCIRGLSIRANFVDDSHCTGVESCPATAIDAPEPLPEPAFLPACLPARCLGLRVLMWRWCLVHRDQTLLVDLHNLAGPSLAALVPPLLPDLHNIQIMRQEHASVDNRLLILHNQGPAMADDELLLHVHACIKLSGRKDVHMIDPVLAASWLRAGTVAQVRTWLTSVDSCCCAVAVVPFSDHWIPVVWTRGQRSVSVSIWEVDGVDLDGLNPLHGLICQAWNSSGFAVTCTRRTFGLTHCGAAAFAFLSHVSLLWTSPCLWTLMPLLRCTAISKKALLRPSWI